MQVLLREEGEEYPIDLADLDAQVRQGVVSGDAEVMHAPWTGASFQRLRDLPVMVDALDTPDARFADYLRARHPTWLTGALAAMVMGAALVQTALADSQAGWAEQRLHTTFLQWMVGLEPTLLDGRWWTPWTSQLVHADLLHALFNVPILAYCGYRVEQALAPSGALAVVAAAVLLGAVAIVGFDDAPVVGSSIAAYGLWAAQIAIGLRMGEAVPRDIRGRYGMGNLIFFAPLYAASLFNAEVSQLGHLGGIVGGSLVAFFLSAETMAPHRDHERTRRRVLILTALLSLAPAPLLATCARLPRLAYAPYTTVSPADAGLVLSLPDRMAEHPTQVGGISAWQASSSSATPLFADLFFMEDPRPTTREWLQAWWCRQLGAAEAVPLPAPAPLGPGWTAHAFQVGHLTVVEHQLQRGRWLVRTGYLLPPAARSPFAGRQALYAASLATLRVDAPPTLTAARDRHAAEPHSTLRSLELARELRYAGHTDEADALLLKMETRAGGWQWEAARERLTLWLEYPSAAADLSDAERRAWMRRYLQAAPLIDSDFHRRGTQWLAAAGDCDTARQHLQTLQDAGAAEDILAGIGDDLRTTCPRPDINVPPPPASPR